MKRRNLIIAFGGIGAGTVYGTGAFSSVAADRTVEVNTAGDGEAYLGIEPTDDANAKYTSVDDGTLVLEFNGDGDAGGDGFNPNSTTHVDEVFTVTNQGTQDVGVFVQNFDTADDVDVDFVLWTGDSIVENTGEPVLLEPGESADVSLEITVERSDAVDGVIDSDSVTIEATVEEDDADSVPPLRNASTGNTYTTLGEAITEADPGDTIEALTGTQFDESLTIDKQDITVVATSNSKPKINDLSISAGGVTVDGLEIAGDGVEQQSYGVLASGGSDVTVKNCNIHDTQFGLYAFGGVDLDLYNNKITDYNFGVLVDDSEVTLTESTVERGQELVIEGDTTPPVGVMYRNSTGKISENTIADNPDEESEDFSSTGISAEMTEDLEIIGNELTGNVLGLEIRGDIFDGSEVTANSTIVEDNEIRENDAIGVRLLNGAVDTTVNKNFIEENGPFGPGEAWGIAIQEFEDEDFPGLDIEVGPPTDFEAPMNDIVGHFAEEFSIGLFNGTDESIDATGCWWGSPDGPEAEDTNDVFGEIDTSPWSTEPGPDWNEEGEAGMAAASTTSDENPATYDKTAPDPNPP